MALELRQQLKLTQQLIMTPQLQMSIKLLQLSRLELVETVSQELEENPTLEEVMDGASDDRAEGSLEVLAPESSPAKEVSVAEKISDDIDWSNYVEEYNTPYRNSFETEEKNTQSFEAFTANKTSLSDHLLWQLMMSSLTPEEVRIGSVIVGNLGRNGYLDISMEELCGQSGATDEKVHAVLSHMQTFDPVGVCARDLKECLLIQAAYFNLNDKNTCKETII